MTTTKPTTTTITTTKPTTTTMTTTKPTTTTITTTISTTTPTTTTTITTKPTTTPNVEVVVVRVNDYNHDYNNANYHMKMTPILQLTPILLSILLTLSYELINRIKMLELSFVYINRL